MQPSPSLAASTPEHGGRGHATRRAGPPKGPQSHDESNFTQSQRRRFSTFMMNSMAFEAASTDAADIAQLWATRQAAVQGAPADRDLGQAAVGSTAPGERRDEDAAGGRRWRPPRPLRSRCEGRKFDLRSTSRGNVSPLKALRISRVQEVFLESSRRGSTRAPPQGVRVGGPTSG